MDKKREGYQHIKDQDKGNGTLYYHDVPKNEYVITMCGENMQRVHGAQENTVHYHNLLEIAVCHTQAGEIFVDGAKFMYGGGDVSIIPPNCVHKVSGQLDGCREYLYIDTESVLADFCTGNTQLAQNTLDDVYWKPYVGRQEGIPEIMQLVNAIFKETHNKQKLYRESIRGMAVALLVYIARMNPQMQIPLDDEDCRQSGELNQVYPAIEYIKQNYASSIKVAELAEICHMSESHFRRLFESAIKMAPVDYLNKVRVRNACLLIRKTGYSMEEISQRVGFMTTSTFNRNFKRIVGKSPYQWKKEVENQK